MHGSTPRCLDGQKVAQKNAVGARAAAPPRDVFRGEILIILIGDKRGHSHSLRCVKTLKNRSLGQYSQHYIFTVAYKSAQ